MSLFFRRLAKAAPFTFSNAFKGSQSSTKTSSGVIAAAISGGISLYYFTSFPNLVTFRLDFICVFLPFLITMLYPYFWLIFLMLFNWMLDGFQSLVCWFRWMICVYCDWMWKQKNGLVVNRIWLNFALLYFCCLQFQLLCLWFVNLQGYKFLLFLWKWYV